MNFRTLIMLAVAALVIVIAVKMNRTSVAEPEELPVQAAPADEMIDERGIMTEEEAQDLIYDDMDGTVDVPEHPNAETDAIVGDEPMTEDEAEQMAPAIVDESPAKALEEGPAEEISEEPVTPSDEKPATEE